MTDGLLAIGAFARASGLSQKALRLYDELGLLAPAYVDPANGYRFYAPDQLDVALLVAWLRRLGMPLATIRDVVRLPAADAAAAVAAFWADVEHRTDARRDLASFLVDHLTRRATMSDTVDTSAPLEVRWAVGTDRGARPVQQDVAHAGPSALAVADGFGDEPDGAASVAVTTFVETLEASAAGAVGHDGLLDLLQSAVAAADAAVAGMATPDAGDRFVGTTFSALVPAGHRLALVHVGDSRIYLLRDGGLFRLTRDDSLVQDLVDSGRLTPEEAWSHPQRAILAKGLFGGGVEADVRFTDARDGDRYLVCSDGLSAVVPEGTLRAALSASGDPQSAVDALLAEVRAAGAPDNTGVVVADVRVPVRTAPRSSREIR